MVVGGSSSSWCSVHVSYWDWCLWDGSIPVVLYLQSYLIMCGFVSRRKHKSTVWLINTDMYVCSNFVHYYAFHRTILYSLEQIARYKPVFVKTSNWETFVYGTGFGKQLLE